MLDFLSYRQKLIALAVAVLALIFALPSSFVVYGAGPALDVNGTVESELGGDGAGEAAAGASADAEGNVKNSELVSVSGVETYQSSSQLFLTTVTAWGTPEAGASIFQAFKALLDPREQLYPLQAVYPQGVSDEEMEKLDQEEMEYSQDSAAAVALGEAGYEVKATLTVAGVDGQYPSGAVLREGDVIKAVRLTPVAEEHQFISVNNFMDFSTFLENVPPGSSIDLQIERDGETMSVSFSTVLPPVDTTGWSAPGSAAGISLTVSDVQLPAEVEYAVKDIGGPSAGMMFALGIYDQLTEGSLAGDELIAGTGTIAWNGRVGAIGGITHKMRGAAQKGAKNFLAPAENCAETIGQEPKGMKVWAVRTLSEAIAAAQAIGAGDTSGLTSCSP